MPGRLKAPRKGKPVARPPGAFPCFADGRQTTGVTADAWSFLRQAISERITTNQSRKALAFVDQAQGFFDAAASPRLVAAPLLFYYSFLNLAKAYLIAVGVPLPSRNGHGIDDPRVNQRQRLRLAGQRVHWTAQANDHSAVFPELLARFSHAAVGERSVSLKDLLEQIPAIHRTYCRVTGAPNRFLPIQRLELLQSDGNVWARVALSKAVAQRDQTLQRLRKRRASKQCLTQVQALVDDELWFETTTIPGRKKGVDNGIRTLADRLHPLQLGHILTATGYRLYLADFTAGQRIPQLCAAYAVMFYLGSVTRYKPYDYERIVTGGYRWIVSEFFATQPLQVLYNFASEVAGCAVTRPYAAAGH